jgi:phage recombination protein Bet
VGFARNAGHKIMEKPKVEKKPEVLEDKQPTKEEVKEIKVIERIIENREIAPQDAFGKMSKSQIELVKRTVAKGASDDELRLFIQVCKGANLNPFLKQVFLVPRWDSKEGKEVRAIQVSIDGFRAIAEESGAYAGNEDAVFNGDEVLEIEQGKEKTKKTIKYPLEAKVTVYKIVEGQRYPFSATARWSEYYPGAKMGFQWHIRPYLMLGKCAEALALRKAFPKLLSGMYAQEELDRSQAENAGPTQTQKGLSAVLEMINKADISELEELKGKVQKTTKYDSKQKKELLEAIESKFNEIDSKIK